MKNIFYKGDIIKKYRDNFGMEVSFNPIMKETKRTDLDVLYLDNREKTIYNNIVNKYGTDNIPSIKKITGVNEKNLAKFLYDGLEYTIKDFITQSKLLGKTEVNEIGIIDIFETNLYVVYDFICEDVEDIMRKLKSNSQKFKNYINENSNYTDFEFILDNNRIQLWLNKDTNTKLSMSSLTSVLGKELIKDDIEYISLGVNESGEHELIELDAYPNIGIVGGSGSGKSITIVNFIETYKLLNSESPVNIITFDVKNSRRLKEISNLHITEEDEFIENLISLKKDMKKRADEFYSKRVDNYIEAKRKGYIGGRVIVIIDELTSSLMRFETKQSEIFEEFKDLISEISTISRNLGYTIIYSGQTATNRTLPKEISSNLFLTMVSTKIEPRNFKILFGEDFRADTSNIDRFGSFYISKVGSKEIKKYRIPYPYND